MRWILPLFALLWPSLAMGQTSDRDYLTALLEDNLSGAGRQVVITGFEGALSSRAQLAKMTIADDAGVWITLTDVVLDWQRSDLLTGRITVNNLTAAEIDLARLPNSQTELTAEAPAFALPELPVAVSIGKISAQKLRLGAPILGEEVTASASASLSLQGGEGKGTLHIERLDAGAPTGLADVAISFVNASRQLNIDVRLSEGKGGLLSAAMGLADRPALDFAVVGAGPLADFTADIALRSDAAQRLGGQVRLLGKTGANGASGTLFEVDIAGDLSPLLQPDYRAFFGTDTALRAKGSTRALGGFDLDSLSLIAKALQLSGSLSMGAAGLPEKFALTGLLQDAGGGPVILPLTLDNPAAVTKAEITANFDAAKGKAWEGALRLQGLDQRDLRLSFAELLANGTIDGDTFDATLALNAEGLQPARAALGRALGSVVWGGGQLAWVSGQGPLKLSQFRLNGDDYQINLNGAMSDLAKGLVFEGSLAAEAQNLGRFADVLGYPMGGAGDIVFDGRAVLLTGAFDGVVQAATRDLAFGIGPADAMLAGQSVAKLDAARGAGGIDIRQLNVKAAGGSIDISGRVAGSATDLAGKFQLNDMPLSQRGFGGQITGDMALTGALNDARLAINARSKGLDLGMPSLRKLLASDAKLSAQVALIKLVPTLRSLDLASQLWSVSAAQQGGDGTYQLAAKLADLGIIAPQFPGPLTVKGRAAPSGDGADLALDFTGPAGLSGQIAGFAHAGQRGDLRMTGRADAGLINSFIAPRSISGATQFDLALRGAPSLNAVTGTVALQSGQLADPSLPFGLRNIAATATVAAGQINLTAGADATSGGSVRVNGTVGASAPNAANLNIALRGLGLRNPDLFETTVSGDLQFTGPVSGGAKLAGRVDMGRTEVRLRPADLGGQTALPGLRHKGDTRAVATTRARAGRNQSATAQKITTPIALDITVRAGNRVFIRGQGLDAELGGEVRLQGSTIDVRPAGAFDLVQGRFEILTKRLTLEEVRLEMQGQLIPYLFVRGTNVRGDVTTTVVIDGPAVEPEFTFSSSPEMPQEEVLSQLLFDQNLQGLSALQSIQLASAIASLTGRGDGVVARARKSLKLDDLDLQTTPEGKTALKMGKYVSDNVYSEFSAESAGKQGLDFTYSLNEKIKLRAGAQTTGNASVGIEFETNY